MSDEKIEEAARAHQREGQVVRALQLELDAKQAEIAALKIKLTAAKVQLTDKRKALKDEVNAP